MPKRESRKVRLIYYRVTKLDGKFVGSFLLVTSLCDFLSISRNTFYKRKKEGGISYLRGYI